MTHSHATTGDGRLAPACAAFEARLADYLERDLAPAALAEAERHRGACARCAALVADLDALRAAAAALPPLEPPADLWAGIEARIAAPVVPLAGHRPADSAPRAASWLHRPRTAAAAALLLVAGTAGVTSTLARVGASDAPATVAVAPPPAPPAPAPPAPPAADAAPDAPADAARPTAGADAPAAVDVGPAPAPRAGGTRLVASAGGRPPAPAASAPPGAGVVEREIGALRTVMRERAASLDTSTVRVLEQNLSIIDRAIRDSREALARDPNSPFLTRQLHDALGEKLELMRTAVLLSGAE